MGPLAFSPASKALAVHGWPVQEPEFTCCLFPGLAPGDAIQPHFNPESGEVGSPNCSPDEDTGSERPHRLPLMPDLTPKLTPKASLLVPHYAFSSPSVPSLFLPPLSQFSAAPASGEGRLTMDQGAGLLVGATVSLWLGLPLPLAVPKLRRLPGGRS